MPRIAQIPLEEFPPSQQAVIRAGVADGRIADSCMFQTYAHSPRLLAQLIAAAPHFPHMGFDLKFGADFCEMLRLRSAQIGGCETCQQARYGENSEALACQVLDPDSFPRREQLALRFLAKMHLDHFSIDDAFFVELDEVFTPAEVVELGAMISQMVGGHRLLSAFDMYGKQEPVVGGKVRAAAAE